MILFYDPSTGMVSINAALLFVIIVAAGCIWSKFWKDDKLDAPNNSAEPVSKLEREPLEFTDYHVIEHEPEDEEKPYVVHELEDIASGGFECSSKDEAKRLVRRLEDRKIRCGE